MGIWVVVMEAVAGDDPNTIEPDDLDALAEELGECYPHVSGGPAFYQAELWVEESNAGGAVMHALRVWQAAVRELGMPTWDVVRAEARDAHAIEAGLIEWRPPDEDEPDIELGQGELDEDDDEEGEDTFPVDLVEDEPDFDIDTHDYELDDDEVEPPARAPLDRPAATKRAGRKVQAAKPAAKKTAAKKLVGAKKAAKKTRTTAARRPKKAAVKLVPVGARTKAKKAGKRIAKRR